MRRFLFILTAVLSWGSLSGSAQEASANLITIEQCVDSACANYPIIRKYALMQATSEVNLDEINTAWLPKIAVTGQSTWQNAVPTFPGKFSTVMAQMGTELKGIPHWQYRAGVEVTQTVWDGGTTSLRRRLERESASLQQASVAVDMYSVRERVENLFFANLLIRDQIAQSQLTLKLLRQNLERVQALVNGGAALQSDADMLEAQALSLEQQIEQAEAAAAGYAQMLELFTGMKISASMLAEPSDYIPQDLTPMRPELRLFGLRKDTNNAAQSLQDAALTPKVALFAQGFYGNPGLDNFRSMTDHSGSFNLLTGIKLSWNFDALYTRRSSRHRTALSNAMIDAEKETLLHNLSIQTASLMASIDGIQKSSKSDERILQLRTNVRKAAEAQLSNGVIDATSLLAKITDENIAALTMRLHRIQLLQEIYKLKYTLNR